MRDRIRSFAIGLAMRRPSPDRIPLSGERAKHRKYFTSHLGTEKGRREYLIRTIGAHGYQCFRFDPETDERTDVSVPFSSLRDLQVSITQYHQELQIDYQSSLEFLGWQAFGVPSLALARDRWAQRTFNRRKLVRNDRNAVVRVFLDKTLVRRDFRLSAVGLMTELYGNRWALHPDNDLMLNYYEIVLDSLVASGDLSKRDGSYRIEAVAFANLDSFEQEERHHRDLVGQQRMLAALTAALVIIGGLQVWDAYGDGATSSSNQVDRNTPALPLSQIPPDALGN